MERNLSRNMLPNLPGSRPGGALPWDAGEGGFVPYIYVPAKATAPVIAGSLATGGVITLTSLGTWAGGTSRPASYAYQIQRGGVDIGGATGSVTASQLPLVVWTAVTADAAAALTCIVTATNPIGATASDASNAITIPVITTWADQSPSALSFTRQGVPASPTANAGFVQFDATDDVCVAGTTPVAIGSNGACTIITRRKLASVLSGAGQAQINLRTDTSTVLCVSATDFGGAYQPRSFWVDLNAVAGNGVGVADALTTNDEIEVWTFAGGDKTDPANFTMRLGGTGKTVLTSGASGRADTVPHSVGGTYISPTLYPSASGVWSVVAFSGVLSAPNIAAAEALIATSAPTYAQYAALGTVVCCLLPGVGWT